MAVSDPTTEYEYPSDDDVEIDDSIADEDYVPPSISSDSSNDECGFLPHLLQIPMQSPTVPDEESCEIPFLPCRFKPRRLQIPVQSATVSRSDPHSDPVNGSTNPDAVKQNLIPDVVPQLEKTGKVKKRRSRIPRPCTFCGTMQTNLHRHIVLKHKNEEVVQHAMKLPEPERRTAFASLKKNGIFKYNKRQMQRNVVDYHAERTKKDASKCVWCSSCHGFYSRSFFSRHRRKCTAHSGTAGVALPMRTILPLSVSDEFKESILAKFRNDEVGAVCCSDSAIIQFGNKQYEAHKGKPDKQMEVKKSVMADMRRLASVFREFQRQCEGDDIPKNSIEMLQRSKYPQLECAIRTYTLSGSEDFRAGLKCTLNYLIKKFAKVCKGMHLVNGSDEKATEIDNFLVVFQLHYHSLFSDATYALNRNRQVKLRRPESLPSDEDVKKLREYTSKRIGDIFADPYKLWDPRSFVELRDLTVCRLTVFNARRGGEPARLVLSEWRDAEQDSWLDQRHVQSSSVKDVEQRMFKDLKITYQGGKGVNHLVPVLIPCDLVEAMRTLSDPSVRALADVHEANQYMFPSTQLASTHVAGWQAVHNICVSANVNEPHKLTATKMRHRVSTLYAAMDVPDSDRHYFYKHMGHSEGINQNIYQAPLAEAEILKVGSCLMAMDSTVTCDDVELDNQSSLAEGQYNNMSVLLLCCLVNVKLCRFSAFMYSL